MVLAGERLTPGESEAPGRTDGAHTHMNHEPANHDPADHGHSHAGHSGHSHSGREHASAGAPAFSLLLLSAPARLALAGALSALVWGGVWLALS